MVRQIQNLTRQNGVAKSIACSVNSYDLEGDIVQVAYSLRDVNDEQIETDVLTFGASVVNAWDTTNTALWNAVANELGAIFI